MSKKSKVITESDLHFNQQRQTKYTSINNCILSSRLQGRILIDFQIETEIFIVLVQNGDYINVLILSRTILYFLKIRSRNFLLLFAIESQLAYRTTAVQYLNSRHFFQDCLNLAEGCCMSLYNYYFYSRNDNSSNYPCLKFEAHYIMCTYINNEVFESHVCFPFELS